MPVLLSHPRRWCRRTSPSRRDSRGRASDWSSSTSGTTSATTRRGHRGDAPGDRRAEVVRLAAWRRKRRCDQSSHRAGEVVVCVLDQQEALQSRVGHAYRVIPRERRNLRSAAYSGRTAHRQPWHSASTQTAFCCARIVRLCADRECPYGGHRTLGAKPLTGCKGGHLGAVRSPGLLQDP